MPPVSRLVLFVLSLLTAFFLFFYLSLSAIPFSARPTLFPRSAIISLTDDNSTFFLARPAAFGPMLPGESKGGLTGQLFVVEEGELGCGDVKEEGVWEMRNSLKEPNVGGLDRGGSGTLIPRLDDQNESLDDSRKKEIPLVTPKTGLITSEPSTKRQSQKGSFEEYKLSLSSQELELASHADIETLQDSALMEGKIVLIQRGSCGFLEKVLWAQRRGAIALIVGDSQRGKPLLTMYARGDTSNVTIPSLFTTYTTAQLLTSLLPPEQDSKEGSGWRRRGEDVSLGDDQDGKDGDKPHKDGLWITLTSTRGPTSPFFDTLLVLVISPLVTLGVVYIWIVMLTLRASIQRRRWRAPKSVVDSFPVRIYNRQERERDRSSPPRDKNPKGAYVGEVAQASAEEVQSVTPESSPVPPPAEQEQTISRIATTSPASSIASSSPATTTKTSRRGVKKLKKSTFDTPQFFSTVSECVICLEDYVDGISRVMRLPCGHEFHVGCITPWLVTRRRTCPICKIDVVKGKRDDSDSNTDDGVSGTDDLESGDNGIISDSNISRDDSSSSSSGGGGGGYEVDNDLPANAREGWFTSYRGLFDWRRIFGGIGLGLGYERNLSMSREVLDRQMDGERVVMSNSSSGGGDSDGGRGDNRSSRRESSSGGRRNEGISGRESLVLERVANERTPLIANHVGARF